MGSDLRVLVAEDDETEVVLYKAALHRLGIRHYHIVRDGAEIIDYLRGQGKYADRATYAFPDWLLVDLKMPKVTGFEVLEWLHGHPECQIVPTVVFADSNQPADVTKAYRLGVNAFFTKPTKYEEMLRVLGLVSTFWTVAQRPPVNPESKCG